MSAGSTFADQQKALRRQFAYSDDYPLAMMIKELNTQILSSRGGGGGRGVRSECVSRTAECAVGL